MPLSDAEREIVATEVPRRLGSRPRAFWLEHLRAHDVCAIPVLRQCEALSEPQTVCNGVVVELDDPGLGRVQQVGVAARLASTPGAVGGPAPTAGQHTAAILAELGYAAESAADLARRGVVG